MGVELRVCQKGLFHQGTIRGDFPASPQEDVQKKTKERGKELPSRKWARSEKGSRESLGLPA